MFGQGILEEKAVVFTPMKNQQKRKEGKNHNTSQVLVFRRKKNMKSYQMVFHVLVEN